MGKPARKGFGAKKAVVKKATPRKAATKKAPTDKPAKKAAVKKTARKAVAKKAPAKKALHPFSASIEPAKPLLTSAKVTPGKKVVVKKPPRSDAPF